MIYKYVCNWFLFAWPINVYLTQIPVLKKLGYYSLMCVTRLLTLLGKYLKLLNIKMGLFYCSCSLPKCLFIIILNQNLLLWNPYFLATMTYELSCSAELWNIKIICVTYYIGFLRLKISNEIFYFNIVMSY